MKIVKDIHTTTSNIAGFALLGVLWAISDSRWWSCSNNGLQVLENWTYGTISLLLGTGVAIVARHYNYGEKLRYYTEMAVRLMFIYALITIALIKTEGYFYDLSLITKQYKLVDIKMSELADAFNGYSPFYQSFNGAILLGGLGMLCFRNTQRVGALVLAANQSNPIAGVWKVDKIDFLAGDISETIKQELEDFDKIIIDKDRFGAVEVGDSLSYFEFIVNPKDKQLEFWNFFDYREIDLKGKYEQISPDTLLYIGRNNKDSLQIILTLEK